MRENDDRTFAKSPILVGKVTGGLCLGARERESLLPKSSEIFLEIFGRLRILTVPYEKS